MTTGTEPTLTTEERVDHFGLYACPFCGGRALFHGFEGDEDCHGCHYIECTKCKVLVDFGTTADPDNKDVALTQLRRHIVPFWNQRAKP
jgi:hypothetical protein